MSQNQNQEEENTQHAPFQPFTNISINPEGAVFTHYISPGLFIGYALGPEGVTHIRDQWNAIEAQQHAEKEGNMPRPPLGLILPMSRVD